MKYKSEVVGIFWRVKKNIENQSRCRIQVIRSNNGKEYASLEFKLYCEDVGIEHQLKASYTPEQNGVSERKNGYIMEMVRCMLYLKDLPKMF
jgi:transposase InsO family protein